jgi:hypothetical protein
MITTGTTITIPDGYYNLSTLKSALNAVLISYDLKYDYSGSKSVFYLKNQPLSNTITVNFAVESNGTSDKYNIKSKLGWILGFRNTTYTVNSGTNTVSEAFVDLNGPRYLYIAIDEFNKGNQYSFISPLYKSLINKNIIGRVSIDSSTHPFGSILPANIAYGSLISDFRSYTGKIDLLKLNVQLLDENGNNVSLNGLDFSFCLEVEHE